MHQACPGMKEYELMSIVHHKALAQGGCPDFPIIVTKNGHILHNHGYENVINKDELILCDAGAENAMHYSGDLIRTFPASKTFTARQRMLYHIVLNAQQAAVDHLPPGVPFIEVHQVASRALVDGLISIGLMKGDPAEAVKEGAHTLFFQCGLGHLMGLDTHDMENLGEEYVGYSPQQKRSNTFGLKPLRLGRPLQLDLSLPLSPVFILF